MPPLTLPLTRISPVNYVIIACVNLSVFFLMWKIRSGLDLYVLLPLISVVAYRARKAGHIRGAISSLPLVIGVWYYFVPPESSFAINSSEDALGLLMFAGTATLLAFLHPRRSGGSFTARFTEPSAPARVGSPGRTMLAFQIMRFGLLMAAVVCVGIAADVTGNWEFKVKTPKRNGSPSFTFKLDGQKLSGTYSGLFGKAPISGTVKDDRIEFSFKAHFVGAVHYTGTIDSPTTMKGEVEYGSLGNGTFTATKK